MNRLRGDRGSAAAELTLLTPVLIGLLLFVVFCGRLADAQLRLADAAHQAARAATLARTPATATDAAQTTANAALAAAGITCRSLAVAADLSGLHPGSTVTVTLTCQVGLADLTLLGLPGSRTVQASASSPVDTWRSTTGAAP